MQLKPFPAKTKPHPSVVPRAMDVLTHQALSHVLMHEGSSVDKQLVKQLHKELAKVKRTLALTQREYTSLIELHEAEENDNNSYCCPGCHSWMDETVTASFFAFRRGDSGLELKVVTTCGDCDDHDQSCGLERKLKGSIWLNRNSLLGDDMYDILTHNASLASERHCPHPNLEYAAALILQEAFLNKWNWESKEAAWYAQRAGLAHGLSWPES